VKRLILAAALMLMAQPQPRPRGVHSTYALDASATSSGLDVLALFGTGTSSGGATYVKRIRPG
jgi:hypothetical protein